MTGKSPHIAVVIVNWNRRDLTLEAIASVEAQNCAPVSVILVDNGSNDGSADAAEQAFPKIKVIRNDRNLGFAGGNQQGIEAALAIGADYILFLNNDATADPGCLKSLTELLESRPKAAAAAPFIVYSSTPDKLWFGGGEVALWRLWVGHRHLREQFRRDEFLPRQSDYLTGCALMARASLLAELGGFDPGYILYSEDVDLSLRFRQAGWELWVTPEAVVRHQVSATSGGGMSPFKTYYRARSMAILMKRWARNWEWMAAILLAPVAGLAMSIRLLLMGERRSIPALWLGALNGVLGRSPSGKFRIG